MKVRVAKPFGYCHGVKRAINRAIKTKESHPETPVYVYGNLVHNAFVREVLQDFGIFTLSRDVDFATLPKGVMITTAHGISHSKIAQIKANGFLHVDATCPLVYKSFDSIKSAVDNQKFVLYLGNKNHPEAIAAYAINPSKIFIFEQLDDLKNLDYSKEYVLTNQTTIRHEDLEKYFIYLLNNKYKVDLLDEICDATKSRQSALKDALLSDYYDIVFIVGDPTSNNSRQLFQIAKDLNDCVYFITSYLEIQTSWLINKTSALISSGASTPNLLVEQVVHFLKGGNMQDLVITKKSLIQK